MSFLSRREPDPLTPKEIARKMAAGGSHNAWGKDTPPLVAAGVPTIAAKLHKEFVAVVHPEANGIGQPDGGSYNTSGSGGKMRAGRPSLPYGCVWCGVCDKPADFEEGGLHDYFGKADSDGFHRGYILVLARCHGEEREITVSFQQCRHNAGKVILAWPFPKKAKAVEYGGSRPLLALPAPPVRLLLRNAGENYWTRPATYRCEIVMGSVVVVPETVVAVYYRKKPEFESDFERRTREIIERFERRQSGSKNT